MYYLGLPFRETSLIAESELASATAYFVKKDRHTAPAESVFEYIIDEKIVLVIYEEAVWDDPQLKAYHEQQYGSLSYFTENTIGERVHKTVRVSRGRPGWYTITLYDEHWRMKIEQDFDMNHLLQEYKEFSYESEEDRGFCKEQVFSPWRITEH